MALPPSFQRHIDHCNNASLPGRRTEFYIAGQPAGWVTPEVAALVGTQADPAALRDIADTLLHAGLYRWRNEAFDVRAFPDGPVLGTIDRGVLPVLGIQAVGVHLNGLVKRADGLHVWIGRRALNKKLDPGKLDHIVGGGVPAGLSPAETLVKEAEEEAGLPAGLVAEATQHATISYAMDRPEGLRRDRLYCYDLMIPESFTPYPVDGEVAGFELWPVQDVFDRVRDTDDFKFNVNMVLIDLFQRLELLPR
jgi:8-oxo-dGTP pyrophosphatase MutT (NUDIX family)